MHDKNISQVVISRLPRYFRYLGDLKDEGKERISSGELSKRMNVTASQIRQDFNHSVSRDTVTTLIIFMMKLAKFLDLIRNIIL